MEKGTRIHQRPRPSNRGTVTPLSIRFHRKRSLRSRSVQIEMISRSLIPGTPSGATVQAAEITTFTPHFYKTICLDRERTSGHKTRVQD